MQEEVTQKTIALYVKVGKGAARLTEQALQKAIQKFLEQKSKPAHGKQTMRQLMKQNAVFPTSRSPTAILKPLRVRRRNTT